MVDDSARWPADGGQRQGCHPDDLPKGYQTDPGGQAWQRPTDWHRRLPPGIGLIGLRQVDGMAQPGAVSEGNPTPHRAASTVLDQDSDGPLHATLPKGLQQLRAGWLIAPRYSSFRLLDQHRPETMWPKFILNRR